MLLTEGQAKQIADKLMSFVKADDASVGVSSESSAHLRFADNNFLTSGQSEVRAANVTVWIGGKRGAASTNDFDTASLRQAVEQAEQIARLAPIDREYLPTLGRQTYRQVSGYVEATAKIAPAARAKIIDSVLTQAEKAKVIAAGFHQAVARSVAFATKNGNFGYERSTVVGLSVTARTPDGTSSGYFGRNHFDVARLDASRIASEAIKKTLDGRNARTLEPGRYTVILEPQAVADLLGSFAFGFDARSADEGRSAYSAAAGKTRVGEKLFDERISLYSDPWSAELPGSQAAQAGLPARKIYLIKNGVLDNLVYSRFWAKQKGAEPTAGPVNSIMETSGKPATGAEMLGATTRGLLVSRFWYIRSTDPRTASLTGLTRDGVWFVENGKIQYPVKNFRFNQSIIQMLAPGNVELIGAAERVGGAENAALLPALKLKAFNFTSQSEAV